MCSGSLVLLLRLACAVVAPTHAAASTSTGEVSVAQVMELADRAPSGADARSTVIAYLAGVGEAIDVLMGQGQAHGVAPLQCAGAFNLDETVAVAAVSAAVPDRSQWGQTAATPIIVADMFGRAGCQLAP